MARREYRRIDIRTLKGLKLAERMKAAGWKVGSVGFSTIEFHREVPVARRKTHRKARKVCANPAMTKKHFVAVARILADTRDDMKRINAGPMALAALDQAIYRFVGFFAGENALFDHVRFKKAAKYGE